MLCRTESIYSSIRLDFATSESIFEFSSFCPVANKQFPNRRTAVSLYENSSSPIGKFMRQYYQCLSPDFSRLSASIKLASKDRKYGVPANDSLSTFVLLFVIMTDDNRLHPQ